MNAFRLDGVRAMITGASRGIGLGIAQAMAEAGADLILVARDQAALETAAAGWREKGRQVHLAPLDLRATEKISPWYDQVARDHGCPNVLVNAAGITRRGPAEDLTLADWNETLAVNLTAVFALSQAFARHCIAGRVKGKIINVASLMTAAARKTTAAYTASKGGVGQLTKALAVDWADKGILVNAIAPGYITTDLTEPLWKDGDFDAWVKKRCPLGRWGTPEDIGWPAVFLASPAADYITGQILFVDGGWMATF
jgi:NAD(P)-dependent dehydrogenase (short-subunit alcohol dehydrogenase family)